MKYILEEFQHGDKSELYNQLTAIDNAIPKTIESVLVELNNYDAQLFSIWENEGLNQKLATYLLHYIIPFNELLRSNKKHDIPKLLAAELLSFFAWRTFDNCVDGHDLSKSAHLSSLASCIKLIGFVQKYFPNITVVDIYQHYRVMAEQSFYEVEQPVELNDIWKRCSIVFYAIETLASLDEISVTLFKNYINYTGLAHDMADIISDVSNQIVSLPVYWLREENELGIINVATISNLYSKARVAIKPIEDGFITLEVKNNYPLISHLLLQANSLFHKKNHPKPSNN